MKSILNPNFFIMMLRCAVIELQQGPMDDLFLQGGAG